MLVCPTCGRIVDDDQDSCADDGSGLHPLIDGPTVLDGTYQLEHRIEIGGMGVVASAEHRGLKRKVAVKLLRPGRTLDQRARRRLRTEAEALGRLDHPNIVRVTDYGFDPRGGGIPYLVMELVDGVSLRRHQREGSSSEPSDVLGTLSAVAAALDAAHAAGVVHGDLKPENVLVTTAGLEGDGSIKVVDFGLARLLAIDDDGPAEGGLGPPARAHGWTGTPAYMAPELFRGESPGPASDVYAFAVLAFELLTGRQPFDRSGNDLVVAHLSETPPAPSTVNPSVAHELDTPILEGLAKRPEHRPESAGAVATALRRAELAARRRRWRLRELPRRRRLTLAAALVATTLTAALTFTNLLDKLETRTVATRFRLAPARSPDPRLLLVVLDDQSLETNPAPLTGRADELAGLLDALFDAGAAAVGIDILLPPSWAEVERFTRSLVEHADRTVLAAMRTPRGELIGGECLHGPVTIAVGADRAASLLGLVHLDAASLRATSRFRRVDGGSMPSFSAGVAHAAGADLDGIDNRSWIDLRVPASDLPRLSWNEIHAIRDEDPNRFRDRVVIVGLGFSGLGDVFRDLPAPSGAPARVTGFELQALMTNTLLQSPAVYDAPSSVTGLIMALVSIIIAATLLLSTRPWGVVPVALVGAAVYAAFAVVAFGRAGLVLPVVPVATSAITALTASLLLLSRSEPCPRS